MISDMTHEELLAIYRKNENPDVPTSQYNQVKNELIARGYEERMKSKKFRPSFSKAIMQRVEKISIGIIIGVFVWLLTQKILL